MRIRASRFHSVLKISIDTTAMFLKESNLQGSSFRSGSTSGAHSRIPANRQTKEMKFQPSFFFRHNGRKYGSEPQGFKAC
ncbi:hypothetical protein MKW98_017762 [Papaver atlanticum]|uniref:Uncharacterized protein n=1 Tax=Papaver atlanticum TaxID=357466 RepID=A0AAD4TBV1_9MAGN|nr:hypothetical protein MKW98_017762 [Papaver atlanticum]